MIDFAFEYHATMHTKQKMKKKDFERSAYASTPIRQRNPLRGAWFAWLRGFYTRA